MNSAALHRLWWILPLVFIIALSFSLFQPDVDYTQFVILGCCALIGIYLVLFKKELFISLCIFLVPISVNIDLTEGSNMVVPTELMTVILALIALGLGVGKPFYIKKILSHPISLILFLDISWLVITSLTSDIAIFSLKRVLARGVFLLVFYLLLSHWFLKKENLFKFFMLYAMGLIVPIIITEIKHAQYSFNPQTVFELCKPFFNDHTVYGACIAFIIPFVLIAAVNAKSFGFGKRGAIATWILFVALVFGEFMAYSRAAWLSLLVSFLFFIFLKLRFKFYHFIIILLTVSALLWVYSEPLYVMARDNDNVSNKGEIGEHILSVGNLQTDASNMERVNRWSCAIRMFEDRPITGFGPGTYQFMYGPYQSIYEMTYISTMSGDKGNAHSEPLTCLAESGLPGLVTYVLWVLATIAFGMRAYYRSKDRYYKNIILGVLLGFITFFAHGLVNSFIDQVKMASLVFVCMAVIVSVDVLNREKPNEADKKNISMGTH
jgi:putative inorganic carbon (HCO3(-)) transporter